MDLSFNMKYDATILLEYLANAGNSEDTTYPSSFPLLLLVGDDISMLTNWGLVTHICVGKLTIIGSDSGLSPGRRQAVIWTNAEILPNGPLGTNFGEFFIVILTV